MLHKDRLGMEGEAEAERFLVARDHKIIERRARTRYGEIDLVALSPDGREVVFIEVKTRRGRGYGSPEEAVTWRKREHLRRSALAWMTAHGSAASSYRIDVVSVLLTPGSAALIEHFENAVGETG